MTISPPIQSPSLLALSTCDDIQSALDAGLAALLGELDLADALVAVIRPDGQKEARSTPALESGLETTLAAIVPPESNRRESSPGATLSGGLDDLLGASLDIGDGCRAVAFVVAAQVSTQADGHRRFATVAQLVLLSIARAVLVERDRKRSGEFTRLLATAKRVAASLELDTVLSAIVQDATTLLGADSGDMLLWDREQEKLRVVAVSSFPPDMLGYELNFGQGLSSQAILAQRTLQVDDYRSYEHRVPELDRYHFGSVLCAPLMFRGVAIGALNIHGRDPEHRFQPGDADLLQAFAGLAAIAIDHARRYENEVRLGRELSDTNQELVRSLSLQQRLTEQVLHGGGPKALARELARVLDRPVVIQDHLWRLIACAAPDGGEAWRPLVVDRPAPKAARRAGATLANPSTAPGTGWDAQDGRVVVPIRVGRDLVGHLVIGWEGTFSAVDCALVYISSTCAALEFAKIRAALDVEHQLRGEVVLELLHGTFSSEEAISLRAARLGYDLAEPRDLLLVDTLRAGEPESDEAAVRRERRLVELIGETLEREAPRSIVVTLGGSLVILAAEQRRPHLATPEVLGRRVQQLVADIIGEESISVGIGDRCARPLDYPASYRLAREALDVMAKLGKTKCIVGPHELGPFRVLIKATAPDELEAFARRLLRPLAEHDQRTSGGLAETLRAYLAEGQVQRRTAERLFVHVNTIVYRLRRIEELLDRDLKDPATIFELSLAVRILDLIDAVSNSPGARPPRPPRADAGA